MTLKVFEILGREVAQLVNERKPAGSSTAQFNAAALALGLSLCRLTAGSFVQSKTIVVTR